MKLSEMSTDHVADVLASAAIELEPILSDEKIMSIAVDLKIDKGENQLGYGIRVAQKMLNTVFLFSKTYRQNIYRVLAEFGQCTPEEVGKRTLTENWAQITDCLNDEVFISFFPQLKSLAQKKSSVTLPKAGPSKHGQR